MFRPRNVAALGAGVLTAAVVFAWPSSSQSTGSPTRRDSVAALVPEAKRRAAYDAEADGYDGFVAFEEFFMGLGLLRRLLVRQAHGAVLEVAAGTGRNLPYLRASAVDTVLLIDCSEPMLNVARAKAADFASLAPLYWSVSIEDLAGALASAPAAPPEPTSTGVLRPLVELSPELTLPAKFDTIVDSFGLCSYEDPVAALRIMRSLLAETDDAQLLLLEHGRGHYNWLNEFLDSRALDHASKWGCWWNRDIGALLDAADLEIVSLRRFHFGTTWMVVAKPKRARSSS
ncbi:methyltransferase OMS1 [Thecamonas trahens ATCC 50062]|uniref:Methyltransferase OMS1 n=1 Tax=Thecamonas trahens ATCC 50062 TaxID=461836 RepID=A0A0L0DE23_THETB|nr:methyltransferase OMS1 [Thecamonas trahens ATCC 50062]KNC50554.1 methyltransferase OMS1 [Thecamonas trahens ATCC 50062]|eukprot:XP_013762444.1 methyltransferase OMS1 [Thecamonas trahens ATCC 50062]